MDSDQRLTAILGFSFMLYLSFLIYLWADVEKKEHAKMMDEKEPTILEIPQSKFSKTNLKAVNEFQICLKECVNENHDVAIFSFMDLSGSSTCRCH